jgi:hypothetical protein
MLVNNVVFDNHLYSAQVVRNYEQWKLTSMT